MREALKLALEAFDDRSSLMKWQMARDAVKEALAQPEPCRHRIADIRNEAVKSGYMCMDCGALFGAYTTPPQRTWVGLTPEEIADIYAKPFEVVRMAEAKLKEKNT